MRKKIKLYAWQKRYRKVEEKGDARGREINVLKELMFSYFFKIFPKPFGQKREKSLI